jgi:hypothetical protein
MANAWPFRSNIPDSTTMAHSSLRDGNKDILHQTFSHLRSANLTSPNLTGLEGEKAETNNPIKPTTSEFSLDEHQQRIEWNLKAQEGIITYQLPDSLPDGLALHNKLQKLMKTNTIYLNDRRFWSTLENRFKISRKVFFDSSTKIFLSFIM